MENSMVTAIFAFLPVCLLSVSAHAQPVVLSTQETSFGKDVEGIVPSTIVVSPDSRRMAYVAKRDGEAHAVVDGNESRGYIGVFGLVFSADSKGLAHVARRESDWLWWSTARKGAVTEASWPIRFSARTAAESPARSCAANCARLHWTASLRGVG